MILVIHTFHESICVLGTGIFICQPTALQYIAQERIGTGELSKPIFLCALVCYIVGGFVSLRNCTEEAGLASI